MIHKKIQLYPDRPAVTLTTYIIDNIDEFPQKRYRPAVIINPGGSYLYTSRREGEAIALSFNAMGYHAFVLDYSTYFGSAQHIDFSNELTDRPEVQYPAPLRDLVRSFEIILDHWQEWELNPSQIGVCGFSAGGHNAAMYATHWNKPLIEEMTTLTKEEREPAFLILGYALLDLPSSYEEAYELGKEEGITILERLLQVTLGKKSVSMEELENLSPIYHVDQETPPTFIWTTAEDRLVRPQDSLKFALALADANRPYELHVYERGMHGMATGKAVSATAERHMNAEASTWLQLVESWLNLRFKPEFPLNR